MAGRSRHVFVQLLMFSRVRDLHPFLLVYLSSPCDPLSQDMLSPFFFQDFLGIF